MGRDYLARAKQLDPTIELIDSPLQSAGQIQCDEQLTRYSARFSARHIRVLYCGIGRLLSHLLNVTLQATDSAYLGERMNSQLRFL
jgi:NADH:ubiquinone oxidoreductase subunit D